MVHKENACVLKCSGVLGVNACMLVKCMCLKYFLEVFQPLKHHYCEHHKSAVSSLMVFTCTEYMYHSSGIKWIDLYLAGHKV